MADLGTLGWFAVLKKKHGYMLMGNYYYGGGDQNMERGVKIHISATRSSMQDLAEAILPYVNKYRVSHKIMAKTEHIDQAKGENQARKFITIYPQNADQLDELADQIEKFLVEAGGKLKGRKAATADCYPIQGDLPYGKTGYVFLRHGTFDGDDSSDDRLEVSQQLKAAYLADEVEDLFKEKPSGGLYG